MLCSAPVARTVAFSCLMLHACAERIPLDKRPCPCGGQWVCCEALQQCLLPGQVCPEPVQPDAGLRVDATVASDSRSDATRPFVSDALAVYQSADHRAVMQGGRHDLLWTGTDFALMFQVNGSGTIYLAFKIIASDGSATRASSTLTGKAATIDEMPMSQALTLTPAGELRAFWSTRTGKLWMRRVARDGTPIAPAVLVVDDWPEHAGLKRVLPVADGFIVLWIDDRIGEYQYRPYVMRIDDDGAPLTSQMPIATDLPDKSSLGVGGVARHGDGFVVVWGTRSPAGDHVYVSELDAEGKPIGTANEIYAARNVILSYFGQPLVDLGSRLGVALWDLQRGIVLVELERTTKVAERLLRGARPDSERPVAAAAPAQSVRALVVGQGEYRKVNPLTTELVLVTTDDELASSYQQLLNPGAAQAGACLEDYAVVNAGDALGVSWVEGCWGQGRTLYFRRVAPLTKEALVDRDNTAWCEKAVQCNKTTSLAQCRATRPGAPTCVGARIDEVEACVDELASQSCEAFVARGDDSCLASAESPGC